MATLSFFVDGCPEPVISTTNLWFVTPKLLEEVSLLGWSASYSLISNCGRADSGSQVSFSGVESQATWRNNKQCLVVL